MFPSIRWVKTQIREISTSSLLSCLLREMGCMIFVRPFRVCESFWHLPMFGSPLVGTLDFVPPSFVFFIDFFKPSLLIFKFLRISLATSRRMVFITPSCQASTSSRASLTRPWSCSRLQFLISQNSEA